MKHRIPHKCSKCGCDLWNTFGDARYKIERNYVYHKGNYTCIDCFPTKKTNLTNTVQ